MPCYPKYAGHDDGTDGNLEEYIRIPVIQQEKKQAEQKNIYSFVQEDIEHLIVVFHRFCCGDKNTQLSVLFKKFKRGF